MDEDDILFLVDGVETGFTTQGSYMRYSFYSVNSDHTVEIALREYPVTLPEVDGATLNPAPGIHMVAYGAPFRFTVTLSEQVQSDIQVKENGSIIQPERSDAASSIYDITKVTGPIEVSIDGVIPTSNMILSTREVQWSIVKGQLVVNTSVPHTIEVYDTSGVLIINRRINGQDIIRLSTGFYILKTREGVHKIVIP